MVTEADEEAAAVMRTSIAHADIGTLQILMMLTEAPVAITIVAVVVRGPAPDRLVTIDTIALEAARAVKKMSRAETAALVAIEIAVESELLAQKRSQRRSPLRMSVIVARSLCSSLLLD